MWPCGDNFIWGPEEAVRHDQSFADRILGARAERGAVGLMDLC
jgi:hypothetical protein